MKEFFKYVGYGFIVLASLTIFITGLMIIDKNLVCGIFGVVMGGLNFIGWFSAAMLDIINKK